MSKNFALNLPINSVSFGNVSVCILREIYRRGLSPAVFPIGGNVDLSTQKNDEDFNKWLISCINDGQKNFSKKNTAIKLWHINGSLENYSNVDNRLLTFFELDSLTPTEINILKNQNKLYVTSNYTKDIFKFFQIDSEYVPLGFDSHNFYNLETRPKIDGVVSMMLLGKLEKRKAHFKVLNLWAKKYGNNQKYRLNCALSNPFLKPEHQAALINQALEGKKYNNINFLPFSPTNAEYNQVLQSSDIILSLSGGEGRDLPCFHAVGLGAWPVALNAHAYKDYLNNENAVLINPNSKITAVDGVFFAPNSQFNVGNLFDFSEEDFYSGVEEAEKRAKTGINTKGIELQKQSYSSTVDVLLQNLV